MLNPVERRRSSHRSPVYLTPDEAVDYAVNGFDTLHPLASAKSLTGRMMLMALLSPAMCMGLAIIIAPVLAIELMILASILLYGVIALWRAALLCLGLASPPPRYAKAAGQDIFPVYTVLLPVYKEVSILPQLCIAMNAMYYPEDKLDIIVLIEETDMETLKRAYCLPWPGDARIIVVPKGKPQTKPRALNVGLQYARGSFLTIYDAEDRPHPMQLREAVSAFDDPLTGCVQAPLCADTSAKNWLGAQWALEYSLQFGLLQPALARFGLPIMLGGTSNHFRTEALRRLGGWDAWNVTEDAELGIRFAREGLRVKTIRFPTLEKPPHQLGVWMGQRSRWIKGYLQTWLTYTRHQKIMGSELSLLHKFSIFALLAGTLLSAMAFLPGLILITAGILTKTLNVWLALPFLVTLGVSSVLALCAPGRHDGGRLICALTLWLYWPLHTIAACMALKCFFKNPSFWNKTTH